VRWFSLIETNVLKTISVLVLRVDFNRDNGFSLSQAWFPMRMLASQKAEPGKHSDDLTGKPPVANEQH